LYDAQYGTTQLSDQFVAYQEASYLYATDEVSNQLVNLDLTDVPEALYQYYSIFKDGKVYQVDEPAFEFSNEWFNENVLNINETDTLFELVNNDPTVVAVIKTGLSQTEIDAFYTEAYRLALVDFNTYPPFSSLVNLINGYFLEIIGYSAVLSFLIFYIRIMVVTDKGYTMKWWQLPLRSLVLAATLVTALYTIFGSLLLSYTLMVFTKGYRSANDFLSSTKIVDQKSSKIFVDEQTLLAYENQLERGQTQDSTRYIK